MSDELPLDTADDADEEERQAAEALARALDGGRAEPGLPEAALETAALLRFSAGGADLSGARRDQIRAELLAALPAAPTARRPRWLVWLGLGLPLAGAAAAVLLVLAGDTERDALRADASEAQATRAAPADDDGELALQAPSAAASADRRAPPAAPASAAAEGRLAARSKAAATGAAAASSAARSSALLATPEASAALSAPGNGARPMLTGLDAAAREQRSELLTRVHDGELERLHAQLDGARSRTDLQRAEAALGSALGSLGNDLEDGDARLVRQDLYCRLAETALRLGEARAALEWTRQGLQLDGAPNPFLAQLSALEGDALAALGDDASAAQSYMKALKMHETLLDESLDGH